ncbi:hypothetical protein Poli38472_012656 [Pythium oligandrum]|uniref:Transcriptional repressor Tup1 N-terminal domain-containing protein n=1 Tax=Pythium oligandrum TaxID=41045 RepID=A0A8K1CE16_PYTOL|nr:hypothetical protein Poli38472_012656 [Pythium oligandrum]|eukprot:TMW61465.1 hypothetical protein Poli38472_012656 [Pythium oligandrum]
MYPVGATSPAIGEITKVTSRISIGATLDQIKNSYEAIVQQLHAANAAQHELETQRQAQLEEINAIRRVLVVLEANHQRVCEQYEQDLKHLRHQVEAMSRSQVASALPTINKRQRLSPPEERPSTMTSPSDRSTKQPSGDHVAIVPLLRPGGVSKAHSPTVPPLRTLREVTPAKQSSPSATGQTVKTTKSSPPTKPTNNGSKTLQTSPSASKEVKRVKPPSTKTPSTHKWTSEYSPSNSGQERPVTTIHQAIDTKSVVCSVRFSPDGDRIAVGGLKQARIYDIETGETLMCVSPMDHGGESPTQESEESEQHVRAVCFSPDGAQLITSMPHNSNITVWDVHTKIPTLTKTMNGHTGPVYSLGYVDHLIASGSGDRTVRLWDARSASCRAVFDGPTDGVTSVALSPDGRFVAAASLDHIVRVWDIEASRLVSSLTSHRDAVYSVAFAPDGATLASGSLDRSLMLWAMNMQGRSQSRPQEIFQGHKDFILSVAYSPDGRWLLSGSKDRTVKFWEPRSARATLTLGGYRNSVLSISSSSSSSYFATGSGDAHAVVYKYQSTTQ